MGSARRLKLYGYLLVLLMPCVAAAASIDPAVEESLRQQQRQIQLEQQRLQREQREREQRRNAPPLELGSSEAPACTVQTPNHMRTPAFRWNRSIFLAPAAVLARSICQIG